MKKIISLFSLALLTMSAWAQTPATLAEANALEDNTEFTFNGDAVVTVCMSNYLFLRDASGYGMIYGVPSGTFVNGQVLNQGWTATKTSLADGWAKFTDPSGLSASGETNAQLAAAQKLTAFPDESLLNAYVYVEKVHKGMLTIRRIPLPDNTNINITDCLWAMGQEASGDYNIYGIICKVNGTLMFNLVKWETYVEPEILLGDVNNDGEIDITDVTLLINAVLTGDLSGINVNNADCETNGSIDITDVTLLISRVLTGGW